MCSHRSLSKPRHLSMSSSSHGISTVASEFSASSVTVLVPEGPAVSCHTSYHVRRRSSRLGVGMHAHMT
jgi:hypothetical protein